MPDQVMAEFHDGRVRLLGFPEGCFAKGVSGKRGRQCLDYASVLGDLNYARQCLELINQTDNEEIREALWRVAVVSFLKCFNSTGRQNIDKGIFGDDVARECFRNIKDLRDGHFAHGSIRVFQGDIIAVINPAADGYKVEKVVSMSGSVGTLGQENYTNLSLLLDEAAKHVNAKFDTLAIRIAEELEAKSLDELSKLPEPKFKAAV